MPIRPGEPAPWFTAPSADSPEFSLHSVAGRFILLGFLPVEAPACAAALKAVAANRSMLDDLRCSAFMVLRAETPLPGARNARGLRWFLDPSGEVARLYDALGPRGEEQPRWVLLDPSLRVIGAWPIGMSQAVFDQVKALPEPGGHAGVPLHAPVLLSPRILDRDLCDRLVALHQRSGADFTGVMRDVDGRTVAVMDEYKRRRDILVDDPGLRGELQSALEIRLFPQILHALQFQVTEVERYLVGCYDADEGGLFRAHRDNVSRGVAHRKFACSINLNDDFEGGDLRFPEFGAQTYRPPLGGAAVFSCSLLHEATPVTRGRRYAFLPFFFDAAGAAVLDAYRASIGWTAPAGPATLRRPAAAANP